MFIIAKNWNSFVVISLILSSCTKVDLVAPAPITIPDLSPTPTLRSSIPATLTLPPASPTPEPTQAPTTPTMPPISPTPKPAQTPTAVLTGKILYTEESGDTILVLDLATGEITNFPQPGRQMCPGGGILSPDGRWLAIGGEGSLWMVDLANCEYFLAVDIQSIDTNYISSYVQGVRWLSSGYGYLHIETCIPLECLYLYNPETRINRSLGAHYDEGVWSKDDLCAIVGGPFYPEVVAVQEYNIHAYNAAKDFHYGAVTGAYEINPHWGAEPCNLIYNRYEILPPDLDQFIAITTRNFESNSWMPGPAEIWQVDSYTGVNKPLLTSSDYNFYPVSWLSSNLIVRRIPYQKQVFGIFGGPDPVSEGGALLLFDTTTQTLTPYTAPIPTPEYTFNPHPDIIILYESLSGDYRLEERFGNNDLWLVEANGYEKRLIGSADSYAYLP
ncbi:MAG: hypothetical protein HYZ49_12030 [Chloroflexi bacterium]|nr:hypothetical protein [Chloroflexota bacterium]